MADLLGRGVAADERNGVAGAGAEELRDAQDGVDELRGALVEVLLQGAEAVVEGGAAELLQEPSRLVDGGEDAGDGGVGAGVGEGGAAARGVLGDEVAQARAVARVGGDELVAEEVDGGAEGLVEGLHREEETVEDAALVVGASLEEGGAGDAAGDGGGAARGGGEVLAGGAHGVEGVGVEREDGPEVGGQAGEVGGNDDVADAVGEEVGAEEGNAGGEGLRGDGEEGRGIGEVGAAKLRKGGEGLGGVGAAGLLLEACVLDGEGAGLVVGEPGADAGHRLAEAFVDGGLVGGGGGERVVEAVGVGEEVVADHVLEEGAVEAPFLAARLGVRAFAEKEERVAAEDPGGEHVLGEIESAVWGDFAGVEEFAAEGALDEVGGEALLGEVAEGLEDEVAEGPELVGVGAAEADAEDAVVAELVGVEDQNVLAESGVDERALEGGRVVAGEQGAEDAPEGAEAVVEAFGDEPGEDVEGLVGEVLALLGGVGRLDAAWFGPAGLARVLGARIGAVELGEPRVEEFQELLGGDVAVGDDAGVGGVVPGAVEGEEVLVGEGRDRLGVAAGLAAVDGVGEEALVEVAFKAALGLREVRLHLVVDDAVDGEGAGRVGGVGGAEVVALALEGVLGEEGMEDGVEVDVGEVEEVLLDVAADGVVGAIAPGHGVEEGGHAHLDELEERVADGVAPRAAEDGVLEDVGNAAVVAVGRGEVDGEEVLLVVGVEVKHAGAGLGVLELDGDEVELLDGADGADDEAVDDGFRGEGGGGKGWHGCRGCVCGVGYQKRRERGRVLTSGRLFL